MYLYGSPLATIEVETALPGVQTSKNYINSIQKHLKTPPHKYCKSMYGEKIESNKIQIITRKVHRNDTIIRYYVEKPVLFGEGLVFCVITQIYLLNV